MWYNRGIERVEVRVVERVRVIYKSGAVNEIVGSDGTYRAIVRELGKREPAKFVRSAERSIYKYMVSLEGVIGVQKVGDKGDGVTFSFIR